LKANLKPEFMKKKIRFVLTLVVAVVMTACNFTETIYLNPDGSGKFSLDVDASAMMSIAAEQGDRKIDSTFTLKSLMDERKDSIAKLPLAEQQRLKNLESFSVRTHVDQVEKSFLFTLFSDFKKPSDLVDALSVVKTMDDLKTNGSGEKGRLSDMDKMTTDLKYSFDGKKFTRKAAVKDPAIQKQLTDSLATIRPMIEAFTYTVKYHFPKKIKSITAKDPVFSDDRKTVTLQYPFIDYIERPEVMNFEVILEKK